MPQRLLATFTFLAATLLAAPAFAYWPQSRSVDVGSTGAYYGPRSGRLIPDPDGSGYFTLFVSQSGLGTWGWTADHVDADGHTTWPGAVSLNGGADGNPYWNDGMAGPGFAPLGHGASINVWCQAGRVLLNAADSTGNFPSWNPDKGMDTLAYYSGVQSQQGINVDACSRQGGGAFVSWAHNGAFRLLRVDESGRRAPGWPAGGWQPGSVRGISAGDPPSMDLASDGAGGALLAYVNNGYFPAIQRFASDTTVAPGWPAAGVPLVPNAPLSFFSWFRLVWSGPAHVIVVWFEEGQPGPRIRCQRMGLDGQRDPAWPADGVVVSNVGGELNSLTCVEDGSGGATIGWSQTGYEIRRVLVDGTSPGTYAGGSVLVSDFPDAGLARGLGEGACVLVRDPAGAFGTRGIWLDGNGVSSGCEPLDTCHVNLQPGGTPIGALSDGAGGAYYLWTRGTGQYYSTVAASHADYLGVATTSVTPPPPPPSLALAVAPNPSRGALDVAFTLGDGRVARLELLDLAGRRVRLLDVYGAGPHRARFGDLGTLAPGVYLVRLTHGAERRTARAVIVR